MNKNTIIGSILMAVIVIWWMTMNSANAEAQAKAKAEAQAKAAAAQVESAQNGASELVLPAAAPEEKAPPVLGAVQDDSAKASDAVASDSATAAADSAAPVVPAVAPRTVTVETD